MKKIRKRFWPRPLPAGPAGAQVLRLASPAEIFISVLMRGGTPRLASKPFHLRRKAAGVIGKAACLRFSEDCQPLPFFPFRFSIFEFVSVFDIRISDFLSNEGDRTWLHL
jgi:hypothetical protein